jgi:Sec-independent protein secretion pathway component TatC
MLLKFLVIAVVLGLLGALLAWWLLRPHSGGTGSDVD